MAIQPYVTQAQAQYDPIYQKLYDALLQQYDVTRAEKMNQLREAFGARGILHSGIYGADLASQEANLATQTGQGLNKLRLQKESDVTGESSGRYLTETANRLANEKLDWQRQINARTFKTTNPNVNPDYNAYLGEARGGYQPFYSGLQQETTSAYDILRQRVADRLKEEYSQKGIYTPELYGGQTEKVKTGLGVEQGLAAQDINRLLEKSVSGLAGKRYGQDTEQARARTTAEISYQDTLKREAEAKAAAKSKGGGKGYSSAATRELGVAIDRAIAKKHMYVATATTSPIYTREWLINDLYKKYGKDSGFSKDDIAYYVYKGIRGNNEPAFKWG